MNTMEKKIRFSEKWAKLKRKLKDSLYSLKIKIFKQGKGKKSLGSMARGRLIFYIGLISLPLLQFLIFYVYVNFNSILLAFKEYTITDTGQGTYIWVGFKNFTNFIQDLFNSQVLKYAVKNSMTLFLINMIFGVTLALMFSYYIFKKFPLSNTFKVMLFLPSIISSIVMVIMFKYFVESGVPSFFGKVFGKEVMGPLSKSSTAFITIVFYNIWTGFGTGVLMYTGAMSRIPKTVIEAAEIDGVNQFQMFFKIILPLIYPTICTFLVVGIANLFMNQAALYSFFGTQADIQHYTIGYFLFQKVVSDSTKLADYPYAAAAGIIFTLIAAPLTLLVKRFLDKFDPKAEY